MVTSCTWDGSATTTIEVSEGNATTIGGGDNAALAGSPVMVPSPRQVPAR